MKWVYAAYIAAWTIHIVYLFVLTRGFQRDARFLAAIKSLEQHQVRVVRPAAELAAQPVDGGVKDAEAVIEVGKRSPDLKFAAPHRSRDR